MDGSRAPVVSQLQALAADVETDHPAARRFISEALAAVDRLSDALRAANRELDSAAAGAFLDGDHRQRLETLVETQHAELAAVNTVLDRVRALSDLASWAATLDGSLGRPTVDVEDLHRALVTPI